MKKRILALTFLFLIVVSSFSEAFCAASISVESDSAILFDVDQNSVLFEKDANKKMHPASITKIMTLLLSAENCNFDDRFVVDNNCLLSMPSDAVIADFRQGEEISVKDAFMATYLRSANDAAVLLACHVSGSVDKFVELMNNRAKELGANNTHFANPTGLTDDNHYTTAYDMMLIARAASQNEKIMSVAGEVKYTLHKNSVRKEDLEMATSHRMMDKDTAQYYQGVIFGKTGYTNAARATLVTVAKKDDRNLIVVTLGHENRFKQYNDTKILLDYGFGSFYRFVISKDDLKGMVKLKKSEYADIQNDFVIVLPTDVKRENLTQSVDVVNGEIFITLKGGENDVTQKIGTVAEKSGSFGVAVLRGLKLIFTILLYLVVIFIVLFIILLIYINRRNKKRIAEKKRKERINSNYKYYNM